MIKNRKFLWIEYTMWSAGVLFLAVYAIAQARTSHVQSNAIAMIETDWRALADSDPDTKNWSAQRVTQLRAARAAETTPLGLLTIPKLDINVAVFDGTDKSVLDVGAGRVPGTATISGEGNLAIAAHRDGFFRGLKDVRSGDEIALQFDGGTRRYIVSELSIVEPTDVSVLEPTDEPTLTLITCYPFYFVGNAPKRYIVRAVLAANITD